MNAVTTKGTQFQKLRGHRAIQSYILQCFKYEGHLNRSEYIKAQIGVLALSLLGALIVGIVSSLHFGYPLSSFMKTDIYFMMWNINLDREPVIQIVLIIYWGVCITFHTNNSVRRLNDIRGSASISPPLWICVATISCLPYTKIAMSIVLAIKQGTISMPKTALPLSIWSGTQKSRTEDPLSKILQLNELRKSGALSETEFETMKQKLLKSDG